MNKGSGGALEGSRGVLLYSATAAVVLFLMDVIWGVAAFRYWKLPSTLPLYGALTFLAFSWGTAVFSHYRASRARREGDQSRDAIAITAYGMFAGFALAVWALLDVIIDLSQR